MIWKPVVALACNLPRDVQIRNEERLRRRLQGNIRDVLCVGRRFYVSIGEAGHRRRSGPWIVTRHTPKSCRFKMNLEEKAKRGFDWEHAQQLLNEDRFYFTNTATKWKVSRKK